MKNLIKVLFATAVVAIFSFNAFSADPPSMATATVGASATVNAQISFGTPKALAFGNVNLGVAKSIDTDVSDAGKITVNKTPGQGVTITLTAPANLIGPSSATLPFSVLKYAIVSTGGQQVTGTTYSTPVTSQQSSASAFDLYLGGTVTAASNQTPGSYSGDITVAVDYN